MAQVNDIKATVRLVADGLVRREQESEIVAKLVASGIPQPDAPSVFLAIKAACQQGVQSVLTEGLSAPDGPPADPLLAEAFRIGQASLRGAVRRVWLRRALFLLALAMLAILAVWALRR